MGFSCDFTRTKSFNKKDLNKEMVSDESISTDVVVNYSNDLVKDSYIFFGYDNSFVVFKSYDIEILNLVYANKNKSIIAYNIIDNKKMGEIKNAHKSYITNFRYFFDNIKIRDLIISI